MTKRQGTTTDSRQRNGETERSEISELLKESEERVRRFFERFESERTMTYRRPPRRKQAGSASPSSP
jgi:hypothetical protein